MRRLIFTAFAAAISFVTSGACIAEESPEILSLDGTWQIVFDSKNEGKQNNWFSLKGLPRERVKKIRVPSCWELLEKDYEGVAFYRREFKVPSGWKDRIVRLQFDAVNFRSEVWLNGQAVGCHDGGFTPFEFRVDKMIKAGEENSLTVRVLGPIIMENKRIDGIGKMETPSWRGAITGGIWQPVRMVSTGYVYVDDVFIEPNISDNTAIFHLKLMHTGQKGRQAEVELAVSPDKTPGKVVAKISKELDLRPGENQQTWTVKIPDAKYWSPDNPHLYRSAVRVKCKDAVSDRWTARFGMREFTIRDKKFFLNGKPLFLKATFFEGLYPVKLAYPDSREMAVREIRLAKEAGFNMIRPWRKPPPPMWLDLAEEMGVLTVGSLAIECMDFPVESARLPRWVENEVRESILRDRNRACIVQWELFNELKRPVLMQLLHPMALLARKLDPTRLILDESGGWAQGANMYLPYRAEPTKFNDIHDYPGPHVNEEVYTKLVLAAVKSHKEMTQMGLRGRLPGRNVVLGMMTYFSELGYGSLPNLVDNNRRFEKSGNPIAPPTIYHRRLAEQFSKALKDSGFDGIYPDLEKFCLDQQEIHGTANKRMMEAVRCNPRVAGYCIHALTAGDWIVGAGLLDLWRNPKTPVYEGTRAGNRPRIVSIRVRPRNVYAERGTRIEITGVNELDTVEGNLEVHVVSEQGKSIFSKKAPANMASGITKLFEEQIDTGKLKGTYTVKAGIKAKDGSKITSNEYRFDVFTAEQLEAPKTRIAAYDPVNRLKPFLKKTGIEFVEFDANTDKALPVFVSRTDAKKPDDRRQFQDLKAFMNNGGTVIYLDGAGRGVRGWWKNLKLARQFVPGEFGAKRAIGHWDGIPHIVKKHPIFEGLPVNRMMDGVYENVWAQNTLTDLGGETIVASFGMDWFPDMDLHKRHYPGPGDAWWGSDLSIVAHGKGRLIVSQLELIRNLGRDPVADLILYNMIRFAD
jgi:hypothetical protein